MVGVLLLRGCGAKPLREEHEESAAAEEQEESRAAAETIEEASAAAETELPAGVKLDDSANQDQQMDSADLGVATQFAEVGPAGRFWESGTLHTACFGDDDSDYVANYTTQCGVLPGC